MQKISKNSNLFENCNSLIKLLIKEFQISAEQSAENWHRHLVKNETSQISVFRIIFSLFAKRALLNIITVYSSILSGRKLYLEGGLSQIF